MKGSALSFRLLLIILILFGFHFVISAQDVWGLGIRFGDPTGITLKHYTGRKALEISAGRAQWWYGPKWHHRKFENWYRHHHFGHRDFQYIGYRGSVPVSIQVHKLFHKGLEPNSRTTKQGLDWYYGYGGQFRAQRIAYDYRYKLDGPQWYYTAGDEFLDLDIGLDGVIGMELFFKGAPLSAFLDLTLLVEIVDNPFLFWFQGGIGGRFML